MFWKKKRPQSHLQAEMRGALFGDRSLAQAAEFAQVHALYDAPWSTYVQAQTWVAQGLPEKALQLLEQLATRPNLASHHYAQIYHHLRELRSRVNLPLRLLGVVVESSQGEQRYDLLGAYLDRRAQFYPHTGGYARWERPNASLDEAIGIVITMGEVLLNRPPLWTGGPLPPVPQHALRITLVASKGLYVLEDQRQVLLESMIVDRLYTAAEQLMQMMRGLLQE